MKTEGNREERRGALTRRKFFFFFNNTLQDLTTNPDTGNGLNKDKKKREHDTMNY